MLHKIPVILCDFSLRRSVNEIFTLLWYYAAYAGI